MSSGTLQPSTYMLQFRTKSGGEGGTDGYVYASVHAVTRSGQDVSSPWYYCNSPGGSHEQGMIDRYAFNWRSDLKEVLDIQIRLVRSGNNPDWTVGLNLYIYDNSSKKWVLCVGFGYRNIKADDSAPPASGMGTILYSESIRKKGENVTISRTDLEVLAGQLQLPVPSGTNKFGTVTKPVSVIGSLNTADSIAKANAMDRLVENPLDDLV
jgi:hypothetical protein